MAKARKVVDRTKKVEPLDRIANVLGLLLVKDAKPGEAILTLWKAGFADESIAEMLNTTLGSIRQARYMATKKK